MTTSPAHLHVRELTETDLPLLLDYWFKNDDAFLEGMGVDLAKMPTREEFSNMLQSQLQLPVEVRRSFALIWEADGQPVGHSNTNPTRFGEDAYMHLHLWKSNIRRQGLGAELVRLSLSHYFKKLNLKTLYSEPYALNPAPHCVLEKVGFRFVKEYVTTPGFINFEQPVKRWELTRKAWSELNA
ncbi:MAG: GNAT family N-acetyltransferase [Flavobacteriales bacterium]|nr:GNAT family N-acetyltransferase [Flavobacteriales bacterium]